MTQARPAPLSEPTAAELLDRARALIPVLRARGAQGDRERRVPRETIADMQAAGLFKVLQPRRWGGYELDVASCFEIQMALGEGDMSTAWVYGIVGLHPWLLALYDDRAAQDVWARDNTTLISSSLMPVGQATRVDDGFMLTGRWKYSSGSDHCDWAFLGGQIATQPGEPEDRRIFLVPRTDYTIHDVWHVPGLKATGSQDITVEQAFVPDYRTVRFIDNFNGVAAGHQVNTSPLYRVPFGQIFFRGISNASLGALQGMFDAFIEFANARGNRQFGKIADDPMVHLACAEVAIGIDEMKTLLRRNLDVLNEHAARGTMPPLEQRVLYKFHSAAVGERCANLASKLFRCAGGAGLSNDLPFGRMLADITAGRQHLSNQYEMFGRNWGAMLFGLGENKDMIL